MSQVRSIFLGVNDSHLSLQSLLDEDREGVESTYNEANDTYDWDRIHPGQLDRAQQVITEFTRIATQALQTKYPEAIVEVECSAYPRADLEVEPEDVAEAVQDFIDARLDHWIDEAWSSGLAGDEPPSGDAA